MQFIPIFAGTNAKLYAVQYDGEEKDAFEQLFENWQDPEYLFDFFTEHESDLQGGFYDCTVIDAIRFTKDEAGDFRDLIIKTKDDGKLEDTRFARGLFRELSESEYVFKNHRKQKAYGPERDSWLRIYAINVQDCFVITGGAIKLTQRMEERRHTRDELLKLERVRTELKSLGIYDQQGLSE